MPSQKIEQGILQVQQHLEILDKRSAENFDDAEREKRGLEHSYFLYQLPHAWRNHARMLKKAADAVLEQYIKSFPWGHVITFLDMDSVYVYLTGMAIENLLKGIYVARHPELIKLQQEQTDTRGVGYKLHESLTKHNLLEIARTLKKQNNIKFADDELDLMALFERFVTWAGRYRIPLDSITFVDAQFSTYYFPDGEWRSFAQGDVRAFSANFNTLFSKLDDILTNEVEYWRNVRGF